MLLVKKFNFFIYMLLVKKGLEIWFNDYLDRKERFFHYENKIF